MLALHFCMSCLGTFLVKKLLNDSFLRLSANVYELPVESAGTAIENWITHFTAGRNITIKHSWKCYARCGALGVNWDYRVVRMCFVSADQIALPVAKDFGIQCCWHADSSRVLVHTCVHLPLDCYDTVNMWGNSYFEVCKCS